MTPTPLPLAFPVVRASQLASEADARPTPWLVEPVWLAQGVGIVGGPPKSYKTWLSLELAVSVASGCAFLDRFPVRQPGRVLIYMAEDAQTVVRQRLQALCHHHAISLEPLDLFAIAMDTLRLDLAADQARLHATLKEIQPRILLLDPFVRLHRIDENSAAEVSALLAFLRGLQRSHGCAIALVHHTRKNGSVNQPGQALRGSSDIHAWSDSSLYLQRKEDHLRLSFEHRAASAPPALSLKLVGQEDTLHLEVLPEQGQHPSGAVNERITSILEDFGPMDRDMLRERVGVRNATMGEALRELEADGLICKEGRSYRVPDSHSLL